MQEAISKCREAVDRRPDNEEAWFLLGVLLQESGQLDDAQAAFEKSTELVTLRVKPFARRCATLLAYLLCQIICVAVVTLTPENLNLGQDPQREAGWLNLGLLAERRQDSPSALQAYMAALQANPSSSAAYVGLGSVMEAGSKFDAAQAAYEKAIAVDRQHAPAHTALGVMLLRLERPDAARQAAERAIECMPDGASGYLELGAALTELGRPREAEKALGRALEADPSVGQAHNILGIALKAQGRYAEAEAAYKRAVELAPDEVAPLYNIGLFYREQGALYHKAAMAALTKAAQMDPSNLDVRLVLATMEGGGSAMELPRAYVERLFDSCAETYEESVIQGIAYQVPGHLAAAITNSMGADCGCASAQLPANEWAVLDLGCGTGLSGAALRGTALLMAACDVSDNMCRVARRKGIYATVAHADAVSFLEEQPAQAADLIVAGDLLPFIQDPRPLLAAAARVLKPGARFAFTTEEDPRAEAGPAAGKRDAPDAQGGCGETAAFAAPMLNRRARYCHAQAEVDAWAKAHGFSVLVADSCTLHKQARATAPLPCACASCARLALSRARVAAVCAGTA